MSTLLITILAIAAVIILYIIGVFNSLIRLKNRVKEAWADIDVQLKRRYDLIPNLIETVKGYMSHESEVFQKVTEARTKAISATGAESKAQAENMLSGALKTLFAVSRFGKFP
ncbi:MAG: LemA family protein [Parcubacteria group bacterium GW2011_GWF2_39_13b]|nr:MAG: LemA family protein [Parcubacteria group bacterium GW2011_GWF2_39_13b]